MFRDSAKRESRFVGEPSPIHLFPSVLIECTRVEFVLVSGSQYIASRDKVDAF